MQQPIPSAVALSIAAFFAFAPVHTEAQQAAPKPAEPTPASLPGAETHVYRELAPEPLRLHVFKPVGWKQTDSRPALMFFFGGGWTMGTPISACSWGRRAAQIGMVGIAPDYRTKNRFGTSPLEAVADARAALRWVQDHAAELGIDPARIAVGGHSAGGHLALWTAIEKTPPGSDSGEAPKVKPAALLLLSPVSDTSVATGYTPFRFGVHADELSPQHQLDGTMPPALLIHGDADPIIAYVQSVALKEAFMKKGASCELVTVPNGTHLFPWELPAWNEQTLMTKFIVPFLNTHGLQP